jgi:hypothetical protein
MIVSSLFGQWQPDYRMTQSDSFSFLGYNNTWNIAVSGDTVHVIYTDKTPGILQVFYTSSYTAGLSWNTPIMLSNDADNIFEYALAAADNNVHVIWQDGLNQRLIYRRSTNAGQTWSAQETLVYTLNGVGKPCLAVNNDNIYLVFDDGRAGGWNAEIYLMSSNNNGANWNNEQRLTNTASNFMDRAPSLAVNGANLHLTWERFDVNTSTPRSLYLRSTNSGQSWENEQYLSTDTIYQDQAVIAVSGNNVHAVWHDSRFNSTIYYRRSLNNGVTWQSETCITLNSLISDYPTIATIGQNIHVAWRDYVTGQSNIGYCHSMDNGVSWSQETLLTQYASGQECPSIACAGSKVHIIWMDERDGNWEIYYKRNPTGSGIYEFEIRNSKLTNKHFVIFPNPAKNYFTLRFPLFADRLQVKIFDISGKMVKEFKGFGIEESEISLDGIKNGLYFVQVNNKMIKAKLVVTK